MCSEQFYSHFRFEKNDVKQMVHSLRIPSKIICKNKSVATGLEALCITLRRLAYPNRLADLVPIFGRSESEISLIYNTVILFLFSLWQFLSKYVDETNIQ